LRTTALEDGPSLELKSARDFLSQAWWKMEKLKTFLLSFKMQIFESEGLGVDPIKYTQLYIVFKNIFLPFYEFVHLRH
jgi:hypothetical protein